MRRVFLFVAFAALLAAVAVLAWWLVWEGMEREHESEPPHEPVVLEMDLDGEVRTHDPAATLVLQVSLWSPAVLAVVGAPTGSVLPSAGSAARPWWEDLRLLARYRGEESPLEAEVLRPLPGPVLELGAGEVGSLLLAVAPGALPRRGTVTLVAEIAWAEEVLRSGEVEVRMRRGAFSPAQRAKREGRWHLKAGRPAEALEALDRVLDAEPADQAAHILRGDALVALRRLEEGLEAYVRALELEPDLPYGPEHEPPVPLYRKIEELEERLLERP